jgi:hemerythrin
MRKTVSARKNGEAFLMLKWDVVYHIGVPVLDKQHNRIIELANDLVVNILRCEDIEKERQITEAALAELVAYTAKHLQEEESYMQQYNYPEIAEHKREHEILMTEAQRILAESQQGKSGFSFDALMVMKKWLEEHILVCDKKLGEFLQLAEEK